MEVEEGPSDGETEVHERIDLIILANAKRMKLTFIELNEFRMKDFMEYADIWLDKEKPRQATQADIDRFYA